LAVCILGFSFAVYQTRTSVIGGSTIDLSAISAESTPATWYAVPLRQIGKVENSVAANLIVDFQSSSMLVGHLRCSDYLFSTPVELPIAASKWMEIRGLDVIGNSPSGLVVGYFEKCDAAKNVYIKATMGTTTQKYQALTAFCLSCGILLLFYARRLNPSDNPCQTGMKLQGVNK
jgi:hypothetical protein